MDVQVDQAAEPLHECDRPGSWREPRVVVPIPIPMRQRPSRTVLACAARASDVVRRRQLATFVVIVVCAVGRCQFASNLEVGVVGVFFPNPPTT